MKVHKYSGQEERLILMALVVHTEVLGRVVAGLQTEKEPFKSKWSNLVYRWCRSYYEKYQKAPRRNLEPLFRSYAAKSEDEQTNTLLEKFLVSLSNDYAALAKDINPDYIIDQASAYFNAVRYGRLRDELEDALLQDDKEAAQRAVASFQPIDFAASSVVDVLTDEKEWRAALEMPEDQSLIEYPGDLGEFFSGQLQRDGFVAFMAPEKRGKTFWLLDVAWMAVRNKRRTFFASVGDMSKRQMLQRIGTRAARRPIKAGVVEMPRKIIRNDSGDVRVKFERHEYSKAISQKDWVAAQRKIHQLTAAEHSLLKLACTANSTTTVEDLDGMLGEAAKEGWSPDVVVVDYADILAPERSAKGQDFRHQTNETWKALRRLSQKWHCLVVTATQSDADSYERKVLTKKNFSEDKRKLAHVTGMVGINQTEEEKQKGLFRLNWVLLREGVFYENRCITVAGCLAVARPAVRSSW